MTRNNQPSQSPQPQPPESPSAPPTTSHPSTPLTSSEPPSSPVQSHEAQLHSHDHETIASVLAQPSTTHSDHDSDASEDPLPLSKTPIDDDLSSDSSCVVCFERPANVTLDPCGHANLCDVCVSRLVKRRCPTCRARARKVTIRYPDQSTVTKSVKEVIAERKQRESRVLEDTLQIVFLGPEKVGKKTLVRKLISKYPLAGAVDPPTPHYDVFSDGTDFSANATIAGANVRLTVLRRTTLTSRRMVLDDVRVLKPDVLVLCCSAHVGSTFDTIMSWDKVLRNNFQKPRVWALLTLDETDATATGSSGGGPPSLDCVHDVAGAINAIFPSYLRPRSHHFCSVGDHFSIGFRSLAKDVVSMGRNARDVELATSIAEEEARSLADREAAGTIADQAAANLMIANNGIAVPGSSTTGTVQTRAGGSGRALSHTGRSFSLRGLRERGGGGAGLSLSGIVNWLAGSNES